MSSIESSTRMEDIMTTTFVTLLSAQYNEKIVKYAFEATRAIPSGALFLQATGEGFTKISFDAHEPNSFIPNYAIVKKPLQEVIEMIAVAEQTNQYNLDLTSECVTGAELKTKHEEEQAKENAPKLGPQFPR